MIMTQLWIHFETIFHKNSIVLHHCKKPQKRVPARSSGTIRSLKCWVNLHVMFQKVTHSKNFNQTKEPWPWSKRLFDKTLTAGLAPLPLKITYLLIRCSTFGHPIQLERGPWNDIFDERKISKFWGQFFSLFHSRWGFLVVDWVNLWHLVNDMIRLMLLMTI